MANTKETIIQIGDSINSHVEQERQNRINNRAFARSTCSLSPTLLSEPTVTIWLTNQEDYQGSRISRDFPGSGVVFHSGHRTALSGPEIKTVYKNTILGEVLTKYVSGKHKYKNPKGKEITVDIHNRATYLPYDNDPSEVEIRISDDPGIYRYQKLSHLLNAAKAEEEERLRQQERLQIIKAEKLELERKLKEEKDKEEQERLKSQHEEALKEERRNRELIDQIEQKIADSLEKERAIRSFMRKNVMLRSQHLLDEYQEEAKRSHIFDGIPIVIEGGPGTGKTTTMIQRLKFLLSYQSLEEYNAPLTKVQIEKLTDPETRDNNWLFFSPTDLLLQYLRENMRQEGLRANDQNTRTVAKYRNKIMKDYKLFNPSKDGPFKDYKISDGEEKLIINPSKTIQDFGKFIIEHCNKLFSKRISSDTSAHIWHLDAQNIKRRCSNNEKIKDIEGLMNLFNSLHDNESKRVKAWSETLNTRLKDSAMKLKEAVIRDENVKGKLGLLFEKWRKERLGIEDVEEDEEAIIDDLEDEFDIFSISRPDFEAQLFQVLKNLLRQLGLKKQNAIKSISKRNQEVLDIVKGFIVEDTLEIPYIGSLALFVRNYASLCRGIESNILGIVPRLYKSFRKSQLESKSYRGALLSKIIKKDSNKHLHPDEQNLIIGFINELLHKIYNRSTVRFSKLQHRFALAFIDSIRNVIGIDEATDYSLLDYYFMLSFRHYEFSSITLSGDLMQGLNQNGIKGWEELKKIGLNNLEVKPLNISYRQLPTLLDMARELYRDELGFYPSYESMMEPSDTEPKPLILVSDDEWEKARWISERIRDILDMYNELPSIAIFVGDKVDISEFIERINDLDLINGIDIVDCSGDKQLQNKEMIRVFRLSEVKGMEFEAAFFYDIDSALINHSEKMMRRYLYVGISRATSHLAATINKEKESISKYFDGDSQSWDL